MSPRENSDPKADTDLLAGLPRTRPQRPSVRRSAAPAGSASLPDAAAPAAQRPRAVPRRAATKPAAAPAAKRAAATNVRPAGATAPAPSGAQARPSSGSGGPAPARAVADALHAVGGLIDGGRSRGEEAVRSALARLRKR